MVDVNSLGKIYGRIPACLGYRDVRLHSHDQDCTTSHSHKVQTRLPSSSNFWKGLCLPAPNLHALVQDVRVQPSFTEAKDAALTVFPLGLHQRCELIRLIPQRPQVSHNNAVSSSPSILLQTCIPGVSAVTPLGPQVYLRATAQAYTAQSAVHACKQCRDSLIQRLEKVTEERGERRQNIVRPLSQL